MTLIEILLLAAVLLTALAGIAGALLLARRRGADPEIADLKGRLAQMAESQAATQAGLAERLQSQERAFTRVLEERLGEHSKRIGDRLHETAAKNHETLSDLRERLAVIDKAQSNIAELSSQVVGLQDILGNKQARGAFGEVQLRDIVEKILPPSAYAFQATLGNGSRADCLLKLPNPPGPIVVDSKFPLESYRALVEARDEVSQGQHRRALGADVRKHVQDIAAKYILPGETAESALLFLPSEAIHHELHANLQNIVDEAHRARVWIVSPTSLWATLHTVRAVLKDVRMREQAGVIQAEVASLLEDVARLDKRVGKLETHFQQAGEDVRQIRISADKVASRGARITELQLEEAEEAEDALTAPAPEAAPVIARIGKNN